MVVQELRRIVVPEKIKQIGFNKKTRTDEFQVLAKVMLKH